MDKHARLVHYLNEEWIHFEKSGIVTAKYGYGFGNQNWKITI